MTSHSHREHLGTGQAQHEEPSHRLGHVHGGRTEMSHEHAHRHVDEDMLSVEEAYQRVVSCFSPLDTETVPLMDSLGLVLAQDVHSPLDLPPLANSAMDGYARSEGMTSVAQMPGPPGNLMSSA